MKTIYLILFLSVISFSCQKEVSDTNGFVNSIPTLTTTVVTTVTNITAVSGGNISDDGGATIIARGVCWSTSANPVATGNHTADGTGTGSFTSNITGLSATTLYYVRAYATNANGTAYGNEISFTTSATTGALPAVTTSVITTITQTTASSGGNVLTYGGSTVTARGICWSTSSNPVITSSHTTDGAGLGNFTSSITTLTASTTYYVRAYATNTNGTAYGNELTFTTVAAPGLPSVTTDVISYVASTSANGGGDVLSDGGSAVTARGICWGTSTAPIVSGNHTTNGAGLGTFVSTMSSLTPTTTYYVRAYASNVNGTTYGNERTFTTSASASGTVYLAGWENNGSFNVARYWKNGVPVSLTDGTKHASAQDITVVGTDVYVVGREIRSKGVAILWKNGVATDLSSGIFDATASSVFVNGTDVYVSGYENDHAKYWKNGVSVSLPDGGAGNSFASGIAVSGTDVYVAGFYSDNSGTYRKPVYWKNGVMSDLASVLPSNKYYYTYRLVTDGPDVYIAGYSHDLTLYYPKYWKNAVEINMPPGPVNAEAIAEGVAVNGSDVYLAGYVKSSAAAGNPYVAKFWKNGVATDITNGAFDGYATCIKIFNADVYVGGLERNSTGNGVAKYWKNGVATAVTDGSHDVDIFSIFVQ